MSWKLLPYEPQSGWPSLDRRITPNAPALYAIYFGTSLQYIGQTIHLRRRLSKHRTNFTRRGLPARTIVRIKYRLTSDLDMPEMRLIHRLRPPLNVTYVKPIEPKLECRLGLAAFDYINVDSSL